MQVLRKNIRKILTTLFVLGLIFLLYKLFIWRSDNNQIQAQIEEINEVVDPQDINVENHIFENNPQKEKDNPYWDYMKLPLVDVDFNELNKINDETRGWIQVPGTNINYPFVQHSDNNFYLNHSFNKEANQAGWLFLDSRNDINNIDRNNIIYGHGRINSVLFGTLKNILKNGWLENSENHVIKLTTEELYSIWQVFSVYNTPTTSDYLVTDFSNDESYENLLKYLKNKSSHDFDVALSKDDEILTLSTCHSSTDKVVMHAKLIRVVEK